MVVVGSSEINSTFYAMRLLSHGLDLSQIEVVEGDEYPATEFSPEEQARALEMLHDIETSEKVSFRTLGPETIQTHLMYFADRIEELATNDLSEAGYDIGRVTINPDTNDPRRGKRGESEVRHARIVVASKYALLLDALRNLLQTEFEVVGTFDDVHALVDGAPALRPDLIILDVGMGGVSGLSAGEHLKRVLPKVKLIYLTFNQDPDFIAEAFRKGASGYVLTTSGPSEIIHAIHEVFRGGLYFKPPITNVMADSIVQYFKPPKNLHTFTLRQREILQLLAEGRSMKEVALVLNVTPRTVAYHKSALMKRLRLETGGELIQFAIKQFRMQS